MLLIPTCHYLYLQSSERFKSPQNTGRLGRIEMVDLPLTYMIIVTLLKEHSCLGLNFLSSIRDVIIVCNSLDHFKGTLDHTFKANDTYKCLINDSAYTCLSG